MKHDVTGLRKRPISEVRNGNIEHRFRRTRNNDPDDTKTGQVSHSIPFPELKRGKQHVLFKKITEVRGFPEA